MGALSGPSGKLDITFLGIAFAGAVKYAQLEHITGNGGPIGLPGSVSLCFMG